MIPLIIFFIFIPMNTQQPALFFGHGNPMNALEKNEYTRAWQESVKGIPKPEAILMISAH